MKIQNFCWVILLSSVPARAADPGYQFTPLPLPSNALWAGIPSQDAFNAGPVINQSHQIALTYLMSDLTWHPYLWTADPSLHSHFRQVPQAAG